MARPSSRSSIARLIHDPAGWLVHSWIDQRQMEITSTVPRKRKNAIGCLVPATSNCNVAAKVSEIALMKTGLLLCSWPRRWNLFDQTTLYFLPSPCPSISSSLTIYRLFPNTRYLRGKWTRDTDNSAMKQILYRSSSLQNRVAIIADQNFFFHRSEKYNEDKLSFP